MLLCTSPIIVILILKAMKIFILEAFHEGSQLSRRHCHVANLGNSRGVAGQSEKDLNNGLSNSLSCLKSKNKQKQYDFERKKNMGKKAYP